MDNSGCAGQPQFWYINNTLGIVLAKKKKFRKIIIETSFETSGTKINYSLRCRTEKNRADQESNLCLRPRVYIGQPRHTP